MAGSDLSGCGEGGRLEENGIRAGAQEPATVCELPQEPVHWLGLVAVAITVAACCCGLHAFAYADQVRVAHFLYSLSVDNFH